MMKQRAILPIATALCLLTSTPVLSYAQTQNPLLSPVLPAGETETSRSLQKLPSTEEEGESVITLLKLDIAAVAKLDRAYDRYARSRLEQEGQIADWQEALKTAQAATTFNKSKASQLSGNISGAEHKVSDAYLKARGEALEALNPLQRIRLEKLETDDTAILDDKYRFLLLSQVEELWRTPIDPETARAILDVSRNAANAAPSSTVNVYQSYPAYPGYYSVPVFGCYRWNGYDSYFAWSSINYGYGAYGYGGYGYGYPVPYYGYQAPFYSHSGSRWSRDHYRDNYQNYPRDRNARPLWRRSTGPTPSGNFAGQPPRSQEPGRPSYRPATSGSNSVGVTPRPTPSKSDPVWERQPQREAPRTEPSRRPDPPQRPDPPRQERPREEPSRPTPPRSDPKPPERSNSGNSGGDGGSRWNRGGGGRGR